MIEVIEKYNIIVDNIYNLDEKNCLIDVIAAIKRIIIFETYELNLITHVNYSNNQKFINLLTCICINETALSFALIYRDKTI